MWVEYGEFISMLPELALLQTFIYMDLYDNPKVTKVLYSKEVKVKGYVN